MDPSSRSALVFVLGWLVLATSAASTPPIPSSPGDSSSVLTVSGRCPTFHWGAAPGAAGYELRVYRVPGPQVAGEEPERVLRVALPASVTGWTPDLSRCLVPGESYGWSVRRLGDEEWSAVRLFRIAAAPSLAEVEEAFATLDRVLAAAGAPPEEPGTETGNTAVATDRSPFRPVVTGLTAPAASPPGQAGVPTESSAPSLVVDGQIHLGAASDLFRSSNPFLWSDGNRNLGLGDDALASNTSGTDHTAIGVQAMRMLEGNTRSTAVGARAMEMATGGQNAALGFLALYQTSGCCNVAVGSDTLYAGTANYGNTAVGYQALKSTTGNRNVALGQNAGTENTSGRDNIFIANYGVTGQGAQSYRIFLGSSIHQKTYIGGIDNATVSGSAVYISNDQLALATSSRRFKQDIARLPLDADRLMALHPVSFRYRPEVVPNAPVEFGLVAEEVAELYPELVVYDEDGQPLTVRYPRLSALLLAEVQAQHVRLGEQAAWLRLLSALLAAGAVAGALLARARRRPALPAG